VTESAEAEEWHRVIRAAVRECPEAWWLQSEAGPVTVEALNVCVRESQGDDRDERAVEAEPGSL
jgi:hypothetical protein